MQGGEAAMVELLGRNLQLSAVFAYNDSMAAGALTALKDNGIAVPQHLSLIGFDDIPIARYTDPQLTTVRYPIASMAKLATELALQGRQGCWIRGNTLFHADFSASPFRRRQIVVPITN
jgi:LacI family transcriptional regulator